MFLTSLLKKNKGDHLGIDIGSKAFKFVKLGPNHSQRPSVDSYGVIEISPSDSHFSKEVGALLSKNKLKGLKAFCAIDDASMKIRKIELPRMPDSDLKEAIKWKMRECVEGVIDEYRIRSSPLTSPEGESNKITLIGYAIKKEVITKLCELITKLGITPFFVEPSVISMSACIEELHPSQNKWVAGIDLGASKSIMSIMGNGQFYFSRPLPGVSTSETNTENYLKKLAAEIQNTLDTFSVTFQVETIDSIFLTGGGALTEGMEDYLSKNVGIKTQILNPFFEMPNSQKKDTLFSQAYALAHMKAA